MPGATRRTGHTLSRADDGAAAREAYPWIRDLLEILDHASSPEELLEHTRMAMFGTR